MYSISGYGEMIADRVRVEAYASALKQAITPDSVVVDLGTGTGFFAVLACRFGARRVYAIEPSGILQVAKEVAFANACGERIEFIQDISTRVQLAERADVIISDLRGVLPLFEQHLLTIVDARTRLLAPGGVLIPLCDTLWAGVVEAPEQYSKHVGSWGEERYGLDIRAAHRMATNTWRKARFSREQLLSKPQCWAALDYTTISTPHISGEAELTIERDGAAHGLSLWFDTTLCEEVCFSNAPGAPEAIYGNAFFPWPTPVRLDTGDRVRVKLQANLVGDAYVWRWATQVLDQRATGRIKTSFNQSTFFGTPLSPTQLKKGAASHIASIGKDGEIDLFILTLMNGDNALDDIAREVAQRFPHRFAAQHDALARVCELSRKYSR
jgi:protein arginine N-methyltransferase 1